MEIFIDNLDYTLLSIVMVSSLLFVSYTANKELRRPILVYGGICLSGFVPIFIPIYLTFMFLKAKSTRFFIYIFLLSICLIFLNISSANFYKNVEFSDLYSGNIFLKERDNISIKGDFLKAHKDQYIVPKDFNIGGTKHISNHYYYEAVPISTVSNQKIRFFITDVEIYNGNPPNGNSVNNKQFNAHVTLLRNIDKGAIEKIRATLKPEQELVFITETDKSRFESNEKTALIGSSIFGLLSFIFSILAFREFKIFHNRNRLVKKE